MKETKNNHLFTFNPDHIQPDVTNDAVLAMVKENLELETNPIIMKLVPKDRDVSNLTFVSFKIGLPVDLKTKALDPTTWPEGLMFREFEQLNNFRRSK